MSSHPPLAMIAAMTRDRVIGDAGGIPWRHSEDMRFFRRMTMGHAVIMGRRTYESMGRPLRDRHNVVVSRSVASLPGCEVVASLEEALAWARRRDACPFVIGGAQLYQAAMPLATHLYLNTLALDVPGDTLFPPLPDNTWTLTREHRSADLLYQLWQRHPPV